jgi:hypothetical protein
LESSGAVSVADQLVRTSKGVVINEMQGNPLQSDITYRGFTASPLLGTPQGLSVYLDGLRVNQPFGEVANWDLIPTSAIDRIDQGSAISAISGRPGDKVSKSKARVNSVRCRSRQAAHISMRPTAHPKRLAVRPTLQTMRSHLALKGASRSRRVTAFR